MMVLQGDVMDPSRDKVCLIHSVTFYSVPQVRVWRRSH